MYVRREPRRALLASDADALCELVDLVGRREEEKGAVRTVALKESPITPTSIWNLELNRESMPVTNLKHSMSDAVPNKQ